MLNPCQYNTGREEKLYYFIPSIILTSGRSTRHVDEHFGPESIDVDMSTSLCRIALDHEPVEL